MAPATRSGSPASTAGSGKSLSHGTQRVATHIAVCIPSGDMVHADFMLSLLHLVQHARVAGFRISIINSKFSLITEARNLCVNAALQARAEWLAFFDSDMVLPPDSIATLMAHQREIVGATYPRRGLPLAFIGNRIDGSALTLNDKGLVEAARLPAGCLLIKAGVFARLKAPYFRCSYHEDAGKVLGEDYWFSDRVRSAGFQLWCDTDLSRQVEHIGAYRYALREGK